MASRPVLLLASSAEVPITAWDVSTGTQLTQYKGNASGRNCLATVGRDYLVGAQANKDALQFWTWHKDQALQRSFVQERAMAVAATPCGTHLAAGGASGALYLWEVASGRLLRSWGGHYKGVSCLAFSDDGGLLLSGAEDTLACAWLLAELLDVDQDVSDPAYMRPQALYSWSEHTLPVTSLAVGAGDASCLVVSVSLDRTIKVHSTADGRLLRSVALPAALMCVALDAGESTIYAGGADGSVYEVSLVGGGGGVAAGRGLPAGGLALASGVVRMEGHARSVTSLAVSPDGDAMVSGSDDGTAIVWDLRSRQALHAVQAPGKHPVTAVLLMPQPEFMVAGPAGGGGGGGRQGPRRPQPLAPLVKYIGQAGSLQAWEGPAVVLDGSEAAESVAQVCGLWGVGSDLPPPLPPYDVGHVMVRAACEPAAAVRSVESRGGVGTHVMDVDEPEGDSATGKDRLAAEIKQLKAELKQAHSEIKRMQAPTGQGKELAGRRPGRRK